MRIADRLDAVRASIAAAAAACGRDSATVGLLAVSKRFPASAVLEAQAAGQQAFGENRVPEFVDKARELAGHDLDWHFVGSVQTNKVRDLVGVEGLALLHSLDRAKLADRLQAALDEIDGRLRVLIQVNATGEGQKHGVLPDDVDSLVEHVRSACPRLELRGFMGMGPLEGDPTPVFERIARLRTEAEQQIGGELPELSLGMTGDLEQAVAAGSTLVRVGTGVFGPRA